MLQALHRTPPRVSRRAGLSLVAGLALAISVPAIYLSPTVAAPPEQSASQEPAQPATATTARLDQAATGQPFRATLPEGVVVEIIGISEHPSKGKAWWAPDGAPIAAPYDHMRGSVQGHQEITREIAYRISEPTGVSLTWEFEPNGSSAGGRPLDAAGQPIANLRAVARAFPQDAQTCWLKIGIGAGEWKSLARSSGKHPQSMGINKHGFAFSRAYVSEGATVVSFADNIAQQDVRLVALGRDDKPLGIGHGQRGGAHDFWLTTVSFPNLQLSEVEGFQVEARPYRWFEITGISLHPGHSTEPKVVELDAPAK